MRTLNVVGCGNVGKTLCRLWASAQVFEIQDVLNRSIESSHRAVEFIGAGRAIGSYGALRSADVYMISVSDNSIERCCEELAAAGRLNSGTIVFHCSGALPCSILSAARERGAFVASVHPVKSFSDPADSAGSFRGTYCAFEGDDPALGILGPAFQAIGGEIFRIDPAFKTIYHAASVIVCNYLVALLEVGLRAYARSGISNDLALKVMEPMVRETVDKVFKAGTARALTGPIARGDHLIVVRQHEALAAWDREIGDLYRKLGKFALELSRAGGNARPEDLAVLGELLGSPDDHF